MLSVDIKYSVRGLLCDVKCDICLTRKVTICVRYGK